uniref:Uncharacterized protein n=1 Tax=Malurus cyaneus samueli TaxID=2593467 RepID=A0A8C5X6M4_9PASS
PVPREQTRSLRRRRHCCMTLCPSPNLLFQKSLKQRLGKSNIQARLGRPVGTLARGALGGRGLALGQRGMPRGALRGRGARCVLRCFDTLCCIKLFLDCSPGDLFLVVFTRMDLPRRICCIFRSLTNFQREFAKFSVGTRTRRIPSGSGDPDPLRSRWLCSRDASRSR